MPTVKNLSTKLALIFCFVFFASCSQKNAPIVNKNKVKYSKNTVLNSSKYKNIGNMLTVGDEIVVKDGDTIHKIAKSCNVDAQELITYNKLQPPYQLKTGSIIKIPNLQYQVQNKDSLYSIANLYKVSLQDLASINNIQPPYQIKAGDILKIPKINKPEVPNSNVANDNIKVAEVATKTPQQLPNKLVSDSQYNKFPPSKSDFFIWPLESGNIISKFGPKSSGLYNDGINIESSEGQAVKSVAKGKVAYVGNQLKGYGNLIIIKHDDGWISAYAHLKDFAVKKGQKVDQGFKIATVGKTGKVLSPQLYFSLRKNKTAVNPENYL